MGNLLLVLEPNVEERYLLSTSCDAISSVLYLTHSTQKDFEDFLYCSFKIIFQ